MTMHRHAARNHRLTWWAGILLILAGGGLAIGSLAQFGQGNTTAGLVLLGMAAFWIISGGSALAWRRHRRRRDDWNLDRGELAPHPRPRKKNDTAFPGYA